MYLSMKKYLMTAAAAIALCGTFTSCSHEDIVIGNGKIDVVNDYETAFYTRFGQPNENQDWGFGKASKASTKTRAMSDYNGYRGSLTPTESYQDPNDNWAWKERPYTFPSAPSSYPTGKPDGATYYAGDYQYLNGGSYYMDETTSNYVDIQGYCDLYIIKSGTGEDNVNITPTARWYIGNVAYQQKIRVFICPGVNFTLLPEFANLLQANVEYYVCPGASFVCNTRTPLNGTALYVAAGATATFSELEGNNDALIFNQGTITVAGNLYIANQNTRLVNEGVINVGSAEHPAVVELAGTGKVQNDAEMNIYGETFVSSNNAIWVNNGHWTTTYYTYVAGSFNVINNCYLEVTENFCMNFGDKQGTFKIDAGGGVLTKNFYGGTFEGKDEDGNYKNFQGGPFRVDMGSNSVFKVTETALLDATKQNGYGFHGVGDGYAVFTAKNIIKSLTGEANVTYAGNLYVSAETHFAQNYSGQYPYIKFEDGCDINNIYAEGFSSGKPDITITQTPCNPGFDGDDDTRTDVAGVMIIAEDLTLGDKNVGSLDFDFNDVVFLVDYVDATTAKITLKAAGGTLPLVIGVPEGQEESASGQYHENEVHLRFGVSINTMVNTGLGSVDRPTPEPFYVSGTFSEDNFAADCNNIRIAVKKNGEWVSLFAERAKAASKMAVSRNFEWCDERQDIEEKYSKFPNWVQDPSISWYW